VGINVRSANAAVTTSLVQFSRLSEQTLLKGYLTIFSADVNCIFFAELLTRFLGVNLQVLVCCFVTGSCRPFQRLAKLQYTYEFNVKCELFDFCIYSVRLLFTYFHKTFKTRLSTSVIYMLSILLNLPTNNSEILFFAEVLL